VLQDRVIVMALMGSLVLISWQIDAHLRILSRRLKVVWAEVPAVLYHGESSESTPG
jgi:hypothetical protein